MGGINVHARFAGTTVIEQSMSSCCALATSLPVFAIQTKALLAHTGQVVECPSSTEYKFPACLVIDDTFIVNCNAKKKFCQRFIALNCE